MLHPDPAKCCSYCGGRDHDFEECPKRKADAEKEEAARAAGSKPPVPSAQGISTRALAMGFHPATTALGRPGALHVIGSLSMRGRTL